MNPPFIIIDRVRDALRCVAAAASVFFAVQLAWAIWSPGVSGQENPFRVAVVVSMNIRPYFEAMEGMRKALGDSPDIEIKSYVLSDDASGGEASLARKVFADAPSALVGIGPEATRFVFNRPFDGIRLYAMVLHPEKIIDPEAGDACGISLQVPFAAQIRIFRQTFPDIRRIGLLYDPANNGDAEAAISAADGNGAEIVSLPVSRREEIAEALRRNWAKIDGLWLIPDRTVITESLVRYIVKEAIANGVAVLGYNRFFFESGAAMAFVVDYEAVGIETARSLLNRRAGEPCFSMAPPFKAWLNMPVTEALGVRKVHPDTSEVEVKP